MITGPVGVNRMCNCWWSYWYSREYGHILLCCYTRW